ncbi:glycosyl hydrolase family 17 [Rhodohalobacter mucosus]|uniref:Endo-1,3-beta-glucanase btgC n=2 Tax=Rhodohalobacter mucosus TaxID=2079485 RepID=A0A316TPT2_9BACT|nr:glycosyl hydrolase family 17 [Rhodohalobacter mucosus]
MVKCKLFAAVLAAFVIMTSCSQEQHSANDSGGITASEILGDPYYRAISFGAYREDTREIQPTIPQLKEDVRILSAMGIRLLRTYNVHYDEAANLLQAIREIKEEDPDFEMYLMLGAWIDAKNAWTDQPDRIRDEDAEQNAVEIDRAVSLAMEYPDIVKVIAVGNEAMVHWQSEYYVEPQIILNWVKHLQNLKNEGVLPEDLWITSSDNFASWGGGDSVYHKEALNELIRAVDFISMHTYPMHDTHYNPEFWGVREGEENLSDMEKIESAMLRSLDYAISQYESVVDYMQSIGVDKPVHIGETGWATISNEYYGPDGARATDEYKSGRYHELIRDWSDQNRVTVFYFEAFDEKWKDAENPMGSENHFGLINLQSQAKYPIWDLVDEGVFDGLTRDGKPITKTYGGDFEAMMQDVLVPPHESEIEARMEGQ